MISLSAKIRKDFGKKTEKIRQQGLVPSILYGPKVENIPLEIDLKEFEKAYKEAGESSLIEVKVDKKTFLVLIHAVEIDAVSQKPIHVDFYQPKLDEEIEATVPLVFEGESLAVKDFGGTLVKNVHELEVKALPQDLPHEIRVDISVLKTFDDSIAVKDLVLPGEGKVKILKEPEERIVFVAEPEKVEEELSKTVEEKPEEVGKAEEKKEGEESQAEETKK
jgi:large subunit ribosomal protein L25